MKERCPIHLDEEGKSLWEQCAWIIEGGAVGPSVALQLQAMALRRELRLESVINGVYASICSRLRGIASRIGPARRPEDIRDELEMEARLYETWAK